MATYILLIGSIRRRIKCSFPLLHYIFIVNQFGWCILTLLTQVPVKSNTLLKNLLIFKRFTSYSYFVSNLDTFAWQYKTKNWKFYPVELDIYFESIWFVYFNVACIVKYSFKESSLNVLSTSFINFSFYIRISKLRISIIFRWCQYIY